MSRRFTERARRRLSLRRETLRKLSGRELDGIAGGTFSDSCWCVPDSETQTCDTTDCWMTTNSRFC